MLVMAYMFSMDDAADIVVRDVDGALIRQARAAAALKGVSWKEWVIAAVAAHLGKTDK